MTKNHHLKTTEILLVILTLVIIAGTIVYITKADLLQGFSRLSTRESALTEETSTDEGAETTPSDLPWWCYKYDEGEEGKPDEAQIEGEGNDAGNGGSIINPPPTNKNTRKDPEGKLTIFQKPTTLKEKIKVTDKNKISTIQWKDVLNKEPSSGTGKTTPKTPRPDPKKAKININYECSCTASNATFKEVDNQTFWCPEYGKTEKNEGVTAIGAQYTVTMYTPPKESCQETLKEKEKIYALYSCTCDETSFTIDSLGKTFDCPKEYGGYREYIDKKAQYEVFVFKAPEYLCDEKWFCPIDYSINWTKISDDCLENKKKVCMGEPADKDMTSACKAFMHGYLMEEKCPSLEDCEKAKKLFDKGVPCFDPQFAGLPSVGDCTMYTTLWE